MSRTKPALDSLTGLRFLAALLVFNRHFLQPDSWLSKPHPQLTRWVGNGAMGVFLFFVLSGFILAYAHEELIPEKLARRKFWIARIARIYPVYLLGFAWFAPFILTHRFAMETAKVALMKSASSGIDTLLLTQSWFHPRFALAWNGPAWTLSVEVVFYLCFPWVNAWVRRFSGRQQVIRLAMIFAGLALVPILLLRVFHNSELLVDLLRVNPLIYLPMFIGGVILGHRFQQRQRVAASDGSWMAITGLLWIFAAMMWADAGERFIFTSAAYLPGCALLIYGLAKGGWFSKAFSTRTMILLGEASYAVYLLQFSLNRTYQALRHWGHWQDFLVVDDPLTPVQFAILLAGSVLVSVVVFKYYENPARRTIRRALEKRLLFSPRPEISQVGAPGRASADLGA